MKFSTPIKPIEERSTPKRPLTHLQPAKETDKTKQLDIQLTFSFTLPRTFWREYFVNRKFDPKKAKDKKWTNALAEHFRQGNKICCLVVTNNSIPAKPRPSRLMIITA